VGEELGQRPSSARRPPAAIVGAWPGEAAGAWYSAEERKAGRQPTREEAGSVLIRVDEVEYVYIYWTACWVGLGQWALLGWAAGLHCIF
jgi:hypothetical protein